MLTTAVVKTMLLKAFSLYKIQLKNVLLCSLYPNTVFIELDTWQYYWKYYYDIYISCLCRLWTRLRILFYGIWHLCVVKGLFLMFLWKITPNLHQGAHKYYAFFSVPFFFIIQTITVETFDTKREQRPHTNDIFCIIFGESYAKKAKIFARTNVNWAYKGPLLVIWFCWCGLFSGPLFCSSRAKLAALAHSRIDDDRRLVWWPWEGKKACLGSSHSSLSWPSSCVKGTKKGQLC